MMVNIVFFNLNVLLIIVLIVNIYFKHLIGTGLLTDGNSFTWFDTELEFGCY